MFKLGEKHPVLFEIVLVFLSFLAAIIFVVAGSILSVPQDICSSVSRIFVGIALFIIYRRAFALKNPLSGFIFAVPALLFPCWNVFYNLSSGMTFGDSTVFAQAFITAAAPAIFEEVLFRGIFIYNLRKKGHSPLGCMFISAVVFSAVHLTNIVGLDLISLALQLAYSLVIGMVLAAVYLKNGSILQIIAVHFLIDFSNRIYAEQASSASSRQIIIFALLLIAEAVYAVLLARSIQEAAQAGEEQIE